MNQSILSVAVALLMALPTVAPAQHDGDIEFEYAAGQIGFVNGDPGYADGLTVFGAEMTFNPGGFGHGSTIFPGFEHEDGGLTPGDLIDYTVLQSRFGNYLNYWNPLTGLVENTPDLFRIDNFDIGSGGNHLVGQLTGGGGPPAGHFIGMVDGSGDFHHHVRFNLVNPNSAAVGAYAILFDLRSSNPLIADSDPFWIVWNFGMSETDHAAAMSFFAAPEPGSLPLLLIAGLGALCRRRRAS